MIGLSHTSKLQSHRFCFALIYLNETGGVGLHAGNDSNAAKCLLVSLLLIVFTLSNFLSPPERAYAAESASETSNQLQSAFESAAKEFHVPLSILMSVSYNETLWEQHNGQPSTSGGYGVMHLTQVSQLPSIDINAKGNGNNPNTSQDPDLHTLDKAAGLIGASSDLLKKDPAENIRGGAALLAQYEKQTTGKLSTNPAKWYGAVAKYSNSAAQTFAEDFANQVYTTINQGAQRKTSDGQTVNLATSKVTPDKQTATSLHLQKSSTTGLDGPKGVDMQYVPALYQSFSPAQGDYGNYDLANRPADGLKIQYIIIHDSEVSYQGTIDTFLRPTYTSANYVIRSSDGQITEMVRPNNVAWQAGNWYINSHSIGIEHEGYAAQGSTWYSEPMYRESAKLVNYLAKRFNIPLDRQHILGHDNVPGLSVAYQKGMHWDPATYWDWSHYFDLLGAPFNSQRQSKKNKNKNIVTINPDFSKNEPSMTYGGQPLAPHPSDFVYLHTAPSQNAPLIADPTLHPTGAGTTAINDWGDKAVAGQTFYKVGYQGDWTAIDYGGQKAWFYNPKNQNTSFGKGIVISPKAGLAKIPVYGSAYPEPSAFTAANLPVVSRSAVYQMPAVQKYVASGPVRSDYYYAMDYNAPSLYHVVKGTDTFYEITYNHRVAFVKTSDVSIVK
jgi:Negative regulator of beta-lactamase expression